MPHTNCSEGPGASASASEAAPLCTLAQQLALIMEEEVCQRCGELGGHCACGTMSGSGILDQCLRSVLVKMGSVHECWRGCSGFAESVVEQFADVSFSSPTSSGSQFIGVDPQGERQPGSIPGGWRPSNGLQLSTNTSTGSEDAQSGLHIGNGSGARGGMGLSQVSWASSLLPSGLASMFSSCSGPNAPPLSPRRLVSQAPNAMPMAH